MTPPKIISVAGPVIIENGRVLLIKSKGKDGAESNWKFPGGKKDESDADFEVTCKREAKEELWIELDIKELLKEMTIKDKNKEILLIHYLADRKGEVTPQNEVSKWDWHDINNLPKDCEPNVYEVIEEYKEKEIKKEGSFNKK
jgi:ADP-ribose pyrophosphatase YjhB (NUDIX family)